jgi:hypothetical protein
MDSISEIQIKIPTISTIVSPRLTAGNGTGEHGANIAEQRGNQIQNTHSLSGKAQVHLRVLEWGLQQFGNFKLRIGERRGGKT